MKIQIKSKLDASVLFKCEADSIKHAVELAIKSHANLRSADLRSANLRYADLRSADLSLADLRLADLRLADLRSANLRYADLRYADLDFSCWPLWCGSKKVKVDIEIVYQLIAHICVLDCDDKIFKCVQKFLLPFAKKFHGWNELGPGEKKP
jgi:hypothetical protein